MAIEEGTCGLQEPELLDSTHLDMNTDAET